MLSQPLNLHLAKPGLASVTSLVVALTEALDGKSALAISPAGEPSLQEKYLSALHLASPTEFEDTAVVICTSGSTGNPKAVEISGAALKANHALVSKKLSGKANWILAINPAFIGGLTVLSRGIIDGAWTYGLTETGKFNVDTFSKASLVAAESNPTIRTSLIWAQVIQLINSDKLETLKMFDAILVGGSKVDNQLFDDLKAEGLKLISTYGLSETCGGVVWDGHPLDQVEVKILEKDEFGTGVIAINSPTNASGYRNSPVLDRETFKENWVYTQDLGQLNDGFLTVIGRIDEIVITGGINVSTKAIEEVIAQCDGVEEVVVIPLADPTWGSIITAIVVGDFNKSEISAQVENQLGKSAKPRVIIDAKNLPLLPNGKVDLVKLKEIVNNESI